jgi:hypothetical protein
LVEQVVAVVVGQIQEVELQHQVAVMAEAVVVGLTELPTRVAVAVVLAVALGYVEVLVVQVLSSSVTLVLKEVLAVQLLLPVDLPSTHLQALAHTRHKE